MNNFEAKKHESDYLNKLCTLLEFEHDPSEEEILAAVRELKHSTEVLAKVRAYLADCEKDGCPVAVGHLFSMIDSASVEDNMRSIAELQREYYEKLKDEPLNEY